MEKISSVFREFTLPGLRSSPSPKSQAPRESRRTIEKAVVNWNESVVLLVATPELSALSDAYATVKVLAGQQKRSRIHLVVNHTARLGDGRAIAAQLQQVLDRYVVSEPGQGIRLSHLADIPADAAARQAAVGRQLLWRTAPACPSALAVEQLACRLEETVLIAQA